MKPDLALIKSKKVPLTEERQALVENSKGLVDRVARVIYSRWHKISFEDLRSWGYVGLTEAAQTFDPSYEIPFEAFAWSRVHGSIMNFIKKDTKDHRFFVARRSAHLYCDSVQDQGHPLTDSDEETIENVRNFSDGFVAALFIGFVSDDSHRSAIQDETHRIEEDNRMKAKNALSHARKSLPDRDRKLIRMLYDEGKDLTEVARCLEVSYATVRRYHQSSMNRLAIKLRSQGVSRSPELEQIRKIG